MTFKSTREYRQLSKKAFLWDSLPFDHMNFSGRIISKYGKDYFNERYNYITGNYYQNIKREQLDTVDKMINLSNANNVQEETSPNWQHVSDMVVPEEYKEIWKNTIPLRYYEDYKDRKHLLDSYLKTLSPEQQAYAIKTMCLNNESKNYLAFLDLQEREMTDEQKIIFQSLSEFYKNEYNKEQVSKEELAKKSLESIEKSINKDLTNQNVTNFLYENDVKNGNVDYARMIEKDQEEMEFFKTRTIDDESMFQFSNLNNDALKMRDQFKQIEQNYMKNKDISNLAMPLDDENSQEALFEFPKLYFSENNQDPAFYNPNLNARMNVNEKRDLFTNQFFGQNNFKQTYNPHQASKAPSAAYFSQQPVSPLTPNQIKNNTSSVKDAYMSQDPYLNLDKNIFNSTNVLNQKQTFNPNANTGSVPSNYNSITNQYNTNTANQLNSLQNVQQGLANPYQNSVNSIPQHGGQPNAANAFQNERQNFASNFANAYQNNNPAFNQPNTANAFQNERQNFASNFANAYQNNNPAFNQPNTANAFQNERQNFSSNFANAYQNNNPAFNQPNTANAFQNERQNFASNFANAYQSPVNESNQWVNNDNHSQYGAFNNQMNQPYQQPAGNVFNQNNVSGVPNNNVNVHPLDGAPLIKLSDILKRRKQPEQQSINNTQPSNNQMFDISGNNIQITQNKNENVQLNSFDETPSSYNKFNYAFKEFIKQPSVYNIVDLIHAREVMEMSNREIVDQIVSSTIQVNNQYAKSITKFPNARTNYDINQMHNESRVLQATPTMVNQNPNQTISLSAIKNKNKTNIANPFEAGMPTPTTSQTTQMRNAYNNALIVNQPNNRTNTPFNLSNPVRDSVSVNLRSITANAINKYKSQNNNVNQQSTNSQNKMLQTQQVMHESNYQQPLFKQPQFQPYTKPIDYLGLKNTNQWNTQQFQSSDTGRLSAFNKSLNLNLNNDNSALMVQKNRTSSSNSSKMNKVNTRNSSEPTTRTAKINKSKSISKNTKTPVKAKSNSSKQVKTTKTSSAKTKKQTKVLAAKHA